LTFLFQKKQIDKHVGGATTTGKKQFGLNPSQIQTKYRKFSDQQKLQIQQFLLDDDDRTSQRGGGCW